MVVVVVVVAIASVDTILLTYSQVCHVRARESSKCTYSLMGFLILGERCLQNSVGVSLFPCVVRG